MGKRRLILINRNKIVFLIISVIIGLSLLLTFEKNESIDKSDYYFFSTAPPFKSINVFYQDSAYNILGTTSDLYFSIDDSIIGKQLLKSSYQDTLVADSLLFDKIRSFIIIPIPRIDSIYKKYGVEYILRNYMRNGIPKLCLEYDTLSQEQFLELNFIIDILIRNGFDFFRDCETGIPVMLD